MRREGSALHSEISSIPWTNTHADAALGTFSSGLAARNDLLHSISGEPAMQGRRRGFAPFVGNNDLGREGLGSFQVGALQTRPR